MLMTEFARIAHIAAQDFNLALNFLSPKAADCMVAPNYVLGGGLSLAATSLRDGRVIGMKVR
jgi:hypothetical protein